MSQKSSVGNFVSFFFEAIDKRTADDFSFLLWLGDARQRAQESFFRFNDVKIRFELDQYINLRPVKLYPGVASPIVGSAVLGIAGNDRVKSCDGCVRVSILRTSAF